ncbi:hypothetical protein CL645_02660 [bacterium]|jgi:bifunctional DNase/RNase|nr:hypothetical protein [bacterium]MBD61743.1 hypothetical protein [bacterium]|tara:strand:- start:1303 stop:1845 length:543 start_codon:yes stop_codon:yes gene_type:complete
MVDKSNDRISLRVAYLITGIHAVPGSNLLLLESSDEPDSVIPVVIGHREAEAIREGLTQNYKERPSPYDLFVNMIEIADHEVVEVLIDKVKKGAYHAKITIVVNNKNIQLDSRTSDAISIALRTHSPFFTTREVFELSRRDKSQYAALIQKQPKITHEEQEGSEFKDFLDEANLEELQEE